MNFEQLQTFSDILDLMEREYHDRVAFCWVDDNEAVQHKSYADFCTDIKRGIFYLNRVIGVAAEQHVAILARNSYDYAVMLYACLVVGIVAVPLNLQKDTEEIITELDDSDTSIVLHDGEFIGREFNFTDQFCGRLFPIDGYAQFSDDVQWKRPDPQSLAAIYFTSGTTAKNKGVMLSQKSVSSASVGLTGMNEYYRKINNLSDRYPAKCLIVLPLYHLGGFGPLLSTLVEGGTANLNRYSKYFFRDISVLDSNVTLLTPIYLEMIKRRLNRSGKAFLNGLDILCTVSAPVATETLIVIRGYDIHVLQAYGLTEVFSAAIMNYSQNDTLLSSIGKAVPNLSRKTQLHVVESELCISGDCLMMGYYNDPLETAKAIDKDGWLHTGDLVEQDKDGYYYIVGRKKNLIILSSGENVNPEEIEQKLYSNPDIFEAVVKESNNKIVAEIYCDSVKRQEIESFVMELNRTLPLYKHIAAVEFRDTPFERTAIGKIKR